MLVTNENYIECLEQIVQAPCISLDTETTGLMWSDRLFSIIISTADEDYYFNYNNKADIPKEYILERMSIPTLGIALNGAPLIFMHNAKYDMRMLRKEGVEFTTRVHDTQVVARLVRNDHMSYKLADCAKRIGYEKDDSVEKWITKNRAFDWINIPGKKGRKQNRKYYEVPWELITKYGMMDGRVTYELGISQLKHLKDGDLETSLYEQELLLTKTCFEMERRGVKVDVNFIHEGIEHHNKILEEQIKEFETRFNHPWVDSSKLFKQICDEQGFEHGTTKKGGPSFDKKNIEKTNPELKDRIHAIRESHKIVGTYFSSFLYYMDHEQVLHANIKQGGTVTGRFSYSEPNLQNLPKKPIGTHPVRKAIIPREGYCLVMIDFDQQEYRMMLDYAGEMGLIREILKGKDVHEATAEMFDATRDDAKTLNFGLLYGQGVGELAKSLKCSTLEAKRKKQKYFLALKRVKQLISDIQSTGEGRGYIRNWKGRRVHLNDKNFSYKLPNALIQGGCGDVLRQAMNECAEFLKDIKSAMLIQVHDELVFEIHKDELHIVEKLKEIMENVYQPQNGLPLTCSVDHSWKSWGDKVEGYPSGN